MAAKEFKNSDVTSIDLMWNQALEAVDAWAEKANSSEKVLLNSAREFADHVKRNQNNMKKLTEQFSKEFREWERTSREELLTMTTSLQYIFPVKSYEELNNQLDYVQKRAEDVALNPYHYLAKGGRTDYFVDLLDQYITFNQDNRKQYVNHVKEFISILRENQRVLVNMMENQIKSIFFPFNKYLENTNTLAKSE